MDDRSPEQPQSASVSTVERLSPGRHGLSREQVVASQRRRLLAAMAEVTADKGYGATTVAHVLKRAKVSRLTFYEHFAGKEECFAAAYDEAAEGVTALMLQALDGEGHGAGGSAGDTDRWAAVERAIGVYLEALAAAPALARIFLVEVYAVGPDFLRRRITMQEAFADAVARFVSASTPQQRLACEAMVGAVVSMATSRIASGDPAGLTELRAPLGALVRRLGECFDAEQAQKTL